MFISIEGNGGRFPVALQPTLYRLGFAQIIWPSAARAWELLNGVKLGALHAPVPAPLSLDRHKRHAEDAFGQEHYPVRDDQQIGQNVDGVQDMANKLMAHMLGLDIPGVEPSTSFYTGCDWWARPSQESSMTPQNNQWPQGSSSMFPPMNMPAHRTWQPDSRDVHPYNGAGYQFDQFGV